MVLSLIATMAKRVGIVCVVFLIAWHLIHNQSSKGKAIVHVPKAGVVVSIDNLMFPVPSMAEAPVVCELSPGRHRVKIYHGLLTLGDQRFFVEPGKDAVLWPYPHNPGAVVSPARRGRRGGPAPASSLAIRVGRSTGGAR